MGGIALGRFLLVFKTIIDMTLFVICCFVSFMVIN